MTLPEENQNTLKKPSPVLLYPPQNPDGLTRDRTQAFMMRVIRLNARAMARDLETSYNKIKYRNTVSTAKPTRCIKVSNPFYWSKHSTCFGRSFRPSSGVKDCTYSNRHLSNRSVDCSLAGMKWNQFHFVPASKQSAVSV